MGKKRRKFTTCPNCSYRFEGVDNFCPNCGQENHSHHAPIKHLSLELLEGITHFDAKFFATTKGLLLYPGQLTTEYAIERRARYVPPIRLYIFVSFIFFLSLSVFSSHERAPVTDRELTSGNLRISLFNETLIQDDAPQSLAGRKDITEETIDSVVASIRGSDWFSKMLLKQELRLQHGFITKAELEHAFVKNSGIALFVLMPLFALFLKLFYIRKKRFYIDHLVFSLHYHSFAFVILTMAVVLSRLTGDDYWFLLSLGGIPIYGLVAMHRVYGGRWRATMAKSVFLYPVYFLCIIGGLLLTFAASLLTL